MNAAAENARVAPVLTPSQAVHLLCPLLSTPKPDGTIERLSCQAGQCALWDWIIPPARVPGSECEGVGKCSIPRRAYAYADWVAKEALAKARPGGAA